jgi:hypothetical protein
MDGVTIVPPAVVDERPVGYENAQRRKNGAAAEKSTEETTAYSNRHRAFGYLRDWGDFGGSAQYFERPSFIAMSGTYGGICH